MTMSIAVSPTEKNQMGGVARRLQAQAAGGGRAMMAANLLKRGDPVPASSLRRMQESMAQTRPRYRIGDGAGTYLARDGLSLTTCSREAWFGDAEALAVALDRFPLARGLRGLRDISSKLPPRAAIRQLWGAE